MTLNYDAIIGFSNGMLKGVELKKNKFKYTNLLDASVGLNTLSIFDENKTIISSQKKIFLFDLQNKKITKKYYIKESGCISGLFKLNDFLFVGADNGTVVIKPIKLTKGLVAEKIDVGSNLACLRKCLTSDKYGTGGNENPLKIWDVETRKVEFTAKSPKPDMLQLKQPCYVSDIRFFNNKKVVVSHKHGVVDLHDPLSSQRRPVGSFTAEKTGFVCMNIIPDNSDYEVIVGSSKGSIFHYDFRGKTKFPVKTFRGSTGSVRAVSCINYLNQMHIMSISLDSHIRTHNFNSGDISLKDYIVAKPMALLIKPEENSIK
ncbi:WD40/YVTN repeat-like-containing domain,WD40-repeat-containing domain [Cinara cedri]|uniref:WD40/YVTN repeat-like-containing domain,WD40-repeat-containing domain n=1 Tax=Cinara cedri TaxID=506608 RepID=A0A5E4MCV9_9HEMI|nr:WD40/YVTN repeat-like-containing domain,WD40-repeat-containing domain [Cinara cedri]